MSEGLGVVDCTIQQFIYKHKVVLHGLLIKLPKVAPPKPNQPIQKLEDERRIGITLCDRDDVDVLVLNMAESCRAQGQDGRPDLGVRDDLNAKDISKARAAILSKGAEDQILPFLIEDEDTGKHVGGAGLWRWKMPDVSGVLVPSSKHLN